MDKVKSYIEKNKDRFLNELFELLRIPSISAQSDHKPDMTRCAEWLAASLMKAGADHAEVLPTEGNPVVFAERIVDPKAKTVLVYGHYDVMPVDPREEWTTEPFEPVVRDGRIVEQGRHLELLQKGGYYHDLYTRQFAEESAARILK